MSTRTGEKIGWTGGWTGSFLWLAVLAVVMFLRSRWFQGAVGLGLLIISAVSVFLFAPWRHPATAYWKLMIPPYVLFFASVAWALWSLGGFTGAGLKWWNLTWILPVLLPFAIIGRRKWTQ